LQRKPPKGKGKSSTETHETTASNQNVDVATQNPAETLIDATQSQPEAAVDNFPTLFDEIPDEVMATLPDAVNGKVVKGKSVKSNTAKKPITGIGSTSTQPIEIMEAGEGTLTREDSAIARDSKLGTCFRAMKSWNYIPKK
jgi:hypothetical protein